MMKKKIVFAALFLIFVLADSTCESEISQFRGAVSVFHKVRKGENLWMIGRMYGMDYQKIKSRNKLKKEILIPGQRLEIFPKPRKAVASWYGKNFHGRRMANGEFFNMRDSRFAAHKFLPLGSVVKIKKGSKEIIVEVADRGPLPKRRDFDLTLAAAEFLGFSEKGFAVIEYLVLDIP